jgi:GDPmannose 4,6-dehydratase
VASGARAFITGIGGQDGSYLAELLLERGYAVYGLVHRPLTERFENIEHLRDDLELVVGDVRDRELLSSVLHRWQPGELYHLAGPTFVPESFERPAETLAAVAGGTAAVLEAAASHDSPVRVMVASSREIFGVTDQSPQRETTACHPTNPYGIGKLAGHLLSGALRDQRGLHACSAILYNHESPRRPEHFVTRKVTRAAAAIKLGLESELVLGALEAVRDWCFAGDAMHAAWLTLQHELPDDYVIASGVGRTVGELARVAFACVGLDADEHIRVDPKLVRAPERAAPVGDPTKARNVLGWTASMSFEAMIDAMVQADLERLRPS